ncbi:MAG: nickel-dependent hydrogenase large subunit [Candidatus Tritonobacter lacicola]|nr:nickel-dependent hydrogenase large subunit [Candidatus Tritonobacter lacicola]
MTKIIPVGPYHPLQEEPEFFQLHVDGENVTDIDITIGYNHRGIEKLSEARTFDQSAFLVERVCGICSTSHPFAFVQAVEDIGKIEVPERALYIRSIVGELERIHSHLLWLGLAGHFLGYNTIWMWAWKCRETVIDILELISGNRQNYAMFKVGGVRRDIDDNDIPHYLKLLDEVVPALNLFRGAVTDDPVIRARLVGVGVLSREEAVSYAAVGPTARASGIAIDVRKDEPYAAYDRIEWEIIVTENGDVYDKVILRVLEMLESVKIARQCLENLPGGEIDANVKEIPPGEGIGRHEAPRGEVLHYVLSDGSNMPVRHKIRAPSFQNVPTNKVAAVGETISDAAIVLAAVDPCYCCTERIAVIDTGGDRRAACGDELIRLSQEKTRRIARRMGREIK